jgi:hypothetical protein
MGRKGSKTNKSEPKSVESDEILSLDKPIYRAKWRTKLIRVMLHSEVQNGYSVYSAADCRRKRTWIVPKLFHLDNEPCSGVDDPAATATSSSTKHAKASTKAKTKGTKGVDDPTATKATSSSAMDSDAKHAKASPKALKRPRKTMESDDSDNEGPRKRRKDDPAATEATSSTKHAKASPKDLKRTRKTME